MLRIPHICHEHIVGAMEHLLLRCSFHLIYRYPVHRRSCWHPHISRGNPLFFRTFPRLINTILPITILRETIFLVSLQQNNDIIMAQEIIGREPEIKEIEALYQTNKPVFAVVYGRRRVDKNLRHKLSTFQEETRCKNALHLTLITTYGLKFNEYAGRIQKVITMDDLFRL